MIKDLRISWMSWCTPVISVLGRLGQEDHEFEASLGLVSLFCFFVLSQRNKNNNNKKELRTLLGT
jgi:hypothetical protein